MPGKIMSIKKIFMIIILKIKQKKISTWEGEDPSRETGEKNMEKNLINNSLLFI